MSDSTTNPRPELGDSDLLRRALMEDFSAYEQLVRRYHNRVYRFVYGMTGSRDDAAELTQQVFMKAWKALGHCREQTGFQNWIDRIALTRVIHTRKSRRRRKTIFCEDFDPAIKQSEPYKKFSSKGGILRKMSLSEFQEKMNEALGTLSDNSRATVVLHDILGWDDAAISKVINRSEKAVCSLRNSAHAKLQGRLSGLSDSEVSATDLAGLLALKSYERPDPARAKKNVENTMQAVRAAHKHPSLLLFPDKSMGWMFAQPRYGMAALFLLFLTLHLLNRPIPEAGIVPEAVETPTKGIMPSIDVTTNAPPVPGLPAMEPVYPSLLENKSFNPFNP